MKDKVNKNKIKEQQICEIYEQISKKKIFLNWTSFWTTNKKKKKITRKAILRGTKTNHKIEKITKGLLKPFDLVWHAPYMYKYV